MSKNSLRTGILSRISELKYALNFGDVSREFCTAEYKPGASKWDATIAWLEAEYAWANGRPFLLG